METMSINEACESLGISRSTIYDEIANGHLETLKIGRRRLVSKEALGRYIIKMEKKAGARQRAPTPHSISTEIMYLGTHGYPDVPRPNYDKRSAGREPVAPAVSGVYFLWEKGRVCYVGRSADMKRRVREHASSEWARDLKVSFLHFKESDLLFAESYYIGICKPALNAVRPHDRYKQEANNRKASTEQRAEPTAIHDFFSAPAQEAP